MMRRGRVRGVLLLSMAFLRPVESPADEIKVFAATVLKDPLEEAAKSFANATHNVVTFRFAGSVELGRQISMGAGADLFFSSGRPQVDALETLGLVKAADRVDLLSNALVIIAPAGSGLAVKSPADLKPVQRIAIPNPKLSQAGEYILSFLRSKGLLSDLEAHFLPFPTSRDTASAVGQGSADAGIVYRTDAKLFPKVRIVLEIVPDEREPITYILVPLSRSKSATTRDFSRFLASPASLAIFERYGFIVLPHSPKP